MATSTERACGLTVRFAWRRNGSRPETISEIAWLRRSLPEPDPENRAAISIRSARPPARSLLGPHLDCREAYRSTPLHSLRGPGVWCRERGAGGTDRPDGTGQLLVRGSAADLARPPRRGGRRDDRAGARRGG